MDLPNIYAGDYKRLIAVPIALVLLSLALIQFVGIQQGIDFKGGVLVTLQASGPVDAQAVESSLASAGVAGAAVRTYTNPVGQAAEVEIEQNAELASAERLVPDFSAKERAAEDAELNLATAQEDARLNPNAVSQKNLDAAKAANDKAFAEMKASANAIFTPLEKILGRQIPRDAADTQSYKTLMDNALTDAKDAYRQQIITAIGKGMHYSSYSFSDVSPTLSAYFLNKAFGVIVLSTVLAGIVVFAVFRTIVPSVAVLMGAACDITIALGAMALFQIPLTLPSFAALLMLIGFSLDTDMLLTIRTLKRGEGTPRERAYDTMKTGMTMSITAMVAFGSLFLLALITHIPTYYQISAVAICGLVGDLVATWGLNAVIILWYAEKRERS
jgi:preprotein translocase subunit SecF